MASAPFTSELIATWVSAVGTAAATLIATIALLWQRLDFRRAFAEQVAIWFDGEVKAKNSATLPASYIGFAATEPAWKWHVIPARRYIAGDGKSTLLPGDTWVVKSAESIKNDLTWPSEILRMQLELVFTDPAGRRWRRTWPTGSLKRYRWLTKSRHLPPKVDPPVSPEAALPG
jgi:hypothetical protein